ncbi:MAG: hypothetical protein WBA74_24725 [Cyclobacteriaceae bacterium]
MIKIEKNFLFSSFTETDGTASGGSVEEDPPSGYHNGSGGVGNNTEEGTLRDFRVVVSKINKESSPLFSKMEGDVYSFLPFHSEESEKKEYNVGKEARSQKSDLFNLYMSEVSVIYGGNNNYKYNRSENNKEVLEIYHATKPDRNHIFLSQSAWIEGIPPTVSQERFQKGERATIAHQAKDRENEIDFIIHDFRPVYSLKEWSGENPYSKLFSHRIATEAHAGQFVRQEQQEPVNIWMVVARPIKNLLKPTANDYYIGLLQTTGNEVPQLYHPVKVFKSKDSKYAVEIMDRRKEDESDRHVATFRIASCIEIKSQEGVQQQ